MEQPALLKPGEVRKLLEEERAAFGELSEDMQNDFGEERAVLARTPFPAYIDPDPEIATNDSGQEVQRFSVIQNLPDLLKDSHGECMRRVVPKVREVLHVAQAEMQLAASSAFLQILQKQLVPLQNYTQTFLQTILNSVDNRDPDIANAWLDTLLDVIDLLPKDIIKKDVMSIAVAKGQLSQSIQSRLACCRILGKIATKFEPFVIKKDILPVVQSLCQDVEYEVRGCMCRQLDSVARGLGLEATKSAILPELVELTNDEESYVRLAGLETVVNILSLLDDDTCTSTIVPLVCKFCQQALSNKDTTLPVVAKQLGRLAHGLSVNLTEDQKHWFIDYYKRLCRIGLSEKNRIKDDHSSSTNKQLAFANVPSDMYPEEEDQEVECRKNASYNFPALVMFTGSRHFKSELLSTFTLLCNDPSHLVRKTVSSGFHEVAKLLGNNAHLIQPELVALLNDDSTEVLKGVVQHLPENLELLSKTGASSHAQDKNSLSDVTPAIMACECVLASSNNWRLQADIMHNLTCLPKCFPSDVIYDKFIPLIYRKMHRARALPVKQAASRTLLVLLRHIKREEQREEVFSDLLEGFCYAKSYHQRAIFIEVCLLVMELYSKVFFKSHYFEPLLELGSDPVPNIRLRLCPLLPKLKSQVKLPTDRGLLQQLEMCVRKLLANERDRDVMAAIKVAVEDMDRTQVQMESTSKLSHRMFNDEDLSDKKKEEEEKHLIEQEEKERQDEERRSAKGEKKREGTGKKETQSKIPGPKRAGTKATPTSSSSSKDKGLDKSRGVSRTEDKVRSTRSERTNKTASRSKIPSSPTPSAAKSSGSGTSAGSAATSRRASVHSMPSGSNIPSPSTGSASRRSSIGGNPPGALVMNKKINVDSTSRKGSASRRISTGSIGNGVGTGVKKKTGLK